MTPDAASPVTGPAPEGRHDALAALSGRLEADRQAAREEAGRRLRLVGYALLGAAAFSLIVWLGFGEPWGLLSLVLVLGALIWSRRPLGAFEARVKAELYPAAIRLVDEGLGYEARGAFDTEALKRARLLPSHERATYTHLIAGTYRGVTVSCCRAHLTRTETHTTTDSQGRRTTETRTVTVFAGHFVLLRPEETFPARVFLRPDGGFLGKLTERGPGGTRQVHTEDPDFERRFDLYADDQVAARVLFTTTQMARVLDASAAFGGRLEATYDEEGLAASLSRGEDRLACRRVTSREGLAETLARVVRETEDLLDGALALLPR